MSDVTLERRGPVTIAEVVRPPANFFDRALLADLAGAANHAAADDTCHVLVLCSRGKHFCAGADFGSAALEDPDTRSREAELLYREGARLFAVGVPVVAAVQGAAVGGGLGLACAADFRVAASTTRMHANFAKLGFHHGFGLSVTLPAIVGAQRARRMLLTSEPVDGDRAHDWGLVDELVEPGQERGGAVELAQRIATGAPLALRSIKHTLDSHRAPIADALRYELDEQRKLWATPESRTRIAAGLSRRSRR